MRALKDGRGHPDLRKQRRAGRAYQVKGIKGKEAGKHVASMQNINLSLAGTGFAKNRLGENILS